MIRGSVRGWRAEAFVCTDLVPLLCHTSISSSPFPFVSPPFSPRLFSRTRASISSISSGKGTHKHCRRHACEHTHLFQTNASSMRSSSASLCCSRESHAKTSEQESLMRRATRHETRQERPSKPALESVFALSSSQQQEERKHVPPVEQEKKSGEKKGNYVKRNFSPAAIFCSPLPDPASCRSSGKPCIRRLQSFSLSLSFPLPAAAPRSCYHVSYFPTLITAQKEKSRLQVVTVCPIKRVASSLKTYLQANPRRVFFGSHFPARKATLVSLVLPYRREPLDDACSTSCMT